MTTRAKRSASSPRVKPSDAIALLKADHRQVQQWFAQFKKQIASAKSEQLALNICAALTTHTSIEEEIFYPAFLADIATGLNLNGVLIGIAAYAFR